jgi:hypothetical protein
MTILEPIATPQTISYLGRYNEGNLTVIITDKQNDNNVYSELLGTVILNGVTSVNVEVPFLKNGNHYLLEVKDNDNLVYRGLIFCTDVTDLQNYSNN